MRIYNWERNSGKTTLLLQKLDLDPNLIYATFNVNAKKEAQELSKTICKNDVTRRIFTISEILDDRQRGIVSRPVLVIDELDLCLRQILRVPVEACMRTEQE